MKSKILALCLMLIGAFSFSAIIKNTEVFAQSGGTVTSGGATSGQSGDSLKISPLRTDRVIKPGNSDTVKVYVQNLTRSEITLKAINNDFVAGSREDGIPDIILDENEFAPTHSLKRFMEPVSDITLGPGERKTVDVVISVPQTAKAGGYFGAIRFAGTGGSADQVSVSGSIASIILVTVPGNVIESLQIKQFAVEQKGNIASRFSSSKDLNVRLRLENKGNVQVAPVGEVFVEKNGKIIHKAKINDITPAGVVLPDSVRKWDVPLNNIGSFGKYKVTAVVSYGGSNQTMTTEQTIWILPTLLVVGVIVAILAIIAIIVAIVASLKAYKRKILRGARRR